MECSREASLASFLAHQCGHCSRGSGLDTAGESEASRGGDHVRWTLIILTLGKEQPIMTLLPSSVCLDDEAMLHFHSHMSSGMSQWIARLVAAMSDTTFSNPFIRIQHGDPFMFHAFASTFLETVTQNFTCDVIHSFCLAARPDAQTLSANALELSKLWINSGFARALLVDMSPEGFVSRLPMQVRDAC